jgi:hypothetical protein
MLLWPDPRPAIGSPIKRPLSRGKTSPLQEKQSFFLAQVKRCVSDSQGSKPLYRCRSFFRFGCQLLFSSSLHQSPIRFKVFLKMVGLRSGEPLRSSERSNPSFSFKPLVQSDPRKSSVPCRVQMICNKSHGS